MTAGFKRGPTMISFARHFKTGGHRPPLQLAGLLTSVVPMALPFARHLFPRLKGLLSNWRESGTGDLPYSPPLRGGVDAPSKNAQVPLTGADGVVRKTYITNV